MPENIQQPAPPEPRDTLFRRMFIWFTSFSLAVTYGWLGGFVRQPDGGLTFHWRWGVLIWGVIGFVSAVFFWRKIWPPGDRISTRGGLITGAIVLAVPGFWWLIFPLRSQSGQHLWEVIAGLVAAAIVLTFGAFLIYRLGRAFEDDKDAE